MKTYSVFRSALVVSVCTGLSRLLGFVREILMAVFFGTTLAKSAFDVAFKVPNLFRRLFGEGALSAAFVPVFTETLQREGLESANRLANRALTMLGIALATIVTGGILAVTASLNFVDPGTRVSAVLVLLRIMFPYLLFICLVALCMSILNSFRHFAVPAATPVLLNLVWIAALLFARPFFGPTPDEQIRAVAWGVLVAGLLQLLVQFPVLRRHGIRFRLRFTGETAKVRRVLLLMGPAAIGMGVHQVNVVIDGVLALAVGPWAPAALTYAERLVYLPLGLFATALGTVLLPAFSAHAAADDRAQMLRTFSTSLRGLMAVMIPAAAGLMVLAEPIVRLTFEWRGGLFDEDSTLVTVRALWFYAPGLVTFSVYKLVVPVFYALQDTRTPVRIGWRVVLLNGILNVAFVLAWPARWAHAGLALSTVLCSGINSIELGRIMQQRIGSPDWGRIGASAGRVLLATALMAAVLVWVDGWLEGALAPVLGPKLTQLGAVAGSVVAGAVAYALAASLLCRAELRALGRKTGRG